jgi:hypothetical protein
LSPRSSRRSSETRRPKDVSALLLEGAPYDEWTLHNRKANRFYILNLTRILGELGAEHTKMKQYFESAQIEVKASGWVEQFPSDWYTSATQLYPDQRSKPKTFSRAATIIVALEMLAQERKPDLNVYDYLRILPAFYFIDRFDQQRLNALTAHFDSLDYLARDKLLAGNADASSFAKVCLRQIGQENSDGLLDQLVAGFCVTKSVAESLCDFVNTHFPLDLHVGPVCHAGDEDMGSSGALGRKNAAPALRVPKRRELNVLAKLGDGAD